MSIAMYNDKYDLAIRAILCGTSLGKSITQSAVQRLIGDDDLTGFFSYIRSSCLGRYFRVLADGRTVTLGIASRELISRESPISAQAIAVFLFVAKWRQDNSIPVPKSVIIEQFVSAERSASRSVARALDELERLYWVDKSQFDGQYTYEPTPVGMESMGPVFLQKIVSESQGRDFRPAEVAAFFGSGRREDRKQVVLPPSLFDFSGPEPKYEKLIRRVIVGTACGRPPTVASALRSLGEDSLNGFESYCLGQGFDRYFRIKVSDDRVVALVDASRVFQAGLNPVTSAAVALAAYIWYLCESGRRRLNRSQLLPVFTGRVKGPSRFLSRTLSVLAKKGWISISRTGRLGMTPAGKMALSLALNLRPGPEIVDHLREFVEVNFEQVLAMDQVSATDAEEAGDEAVDEAVQDAEAEVEITASGGSSEDGGAS